MKLFDYEKEKDQFFINRINHELKTSYKKEDLYLKDKRMGILRNLTANVYANKNKKNDRVAELLEELLLFIDQIKKNH